MKDILDTINNLWPGSSDRDIDNLIWCTPYPFISQENVVLHLEILKARSPSDSSITWAIDEEMRLFDEAMSDFTNKQGSLK